MRRGWLALPILVCAAACSPVRDYQEAARSLRFRLDRAEPRIHLGLPLERSRITFRVVLGVENPSSVPFHLEGFTGDLQLEAPDGHHPLGRIELARPMDLPAGGRASLEMDVSFAYTDLRENWAALIAASRGGAGAWDLVGTLRAQAYGLPLQFPVRTRQAFGGGA